MSEAALQSLVGECPALLERANIEPAVHQGLVMLREGVATERQVLAGLVVFLSAERSRLIAEVIDLKRRQPLSFPSLPGGFLA